ncbi:hypothetical protein A5674_22155 [Mycobacterium malmoense]|uniref:hypothetical protein n=1 Tax=Mycobacterium malmoense TaxID=1780 RepID=UPI00080B0489|nr:hypothetical protein [Mycobacterium malmoense]OCB25008.1 hypothetical protein A5674_22155 [Mycobacterium malmoense]
MALTLNDDQEAELLKTLGMPEADPGATDPADVLAVAKDLADQAQGADPAKPSAVAAAAKAAGLEVIDTASLAALRGDAAEGRRLTAEAKLAKVEATVDDAINKGKIPIARRDAWVAMIQADPVMERTLADIPNDTIPMTEVGHSVEARGDSDEWLY